MSMKLLCVSALALMLTACVVTTTGGGSTGSGSTTGSGFRGDVDDFYRALAQRESSGNPAVENSLGYLGLYQMGELAMIDADWYSEAGARTSRNDWTGQWLTGARNNAVSSKQSYLGNARAQDIAVVRYHDRVWTYIVGLGLDEYEGRRINGILITRSGLLASSHLLGAGTLRDYLEANGQGSFADGFGTSIEEYLSLFANYETRYSRF